MAQFDIEAFRSSFKGGAKSYLFYYIPNMPAGITDLTRDDVTYLVRTTALPETTLEETIVNWQGMDFKFPAKSTFADFTVTFNVDVEAKVRKMFEEWTKLIHNPETNVYGSLEEIMRDQTLRLLDYSGNSIMEYKLMYAWPKTIGAVTLDYASTETAQFDVTFSYIYHKTT
jgi:hypothetical protein